MMNKFVASFLFFTSILLSQNSIIIKSNPNISKNDLENVLPNYSDNSLAESPQYIDFEESNLNKFNHFIGSNYYTINVNDKSGLEKIIAVLESIAGIEYLTENSIYTIDDFTPNDSLTSEQWSLEKIDAYGAWKITKGDSSIIVAIIDTGIDYLHPDLQNQMYINQAEDINGNNLLDENDFDGIDNDGNGFVDDISGWDFVDKFLDSDSLEDGDFFDWDADPMDENDHGTAMAGILAAESNNSIGLSGVAPDIKILNLRAFDKNGEGEEDDVAAAILYAVQMGAKIISMSFGDSQYSQLLQDVIQYAHGQGVVLIGSSGNSGSDEPHFPSGFNEVIAVGATDENDNVASYSNIGSTIDLVAPGSDVVTTGTDGSYLNATGTSASSPHVAGAAALLLSLDDLENDEIKQILKTSADDVSENGWDINSGAGRLNMRKALLSVNSPSIIKFHAPESFSVTKEDTLPIEISVLNPKFSYFDLEYGIGLNPPEWYEISVNQKNQVMNYNIINLDITNFTDTSYSLRLNIILTDNSNLEERINFEIDRSAPQLTIQKLSVAYYGMKETILASIETDDLTNIEMFYRETGATVFSSIILDGFSSNMKFYQGQHFGFIPADEIEYNTEYEIYFEAENKSGLVTINDNQGQLYKFTIEDTPELADKTPKVYSLPFGRLYKDLLKVDNSRFILINENEDYQNLSIYEFQGENFTQIETIENRIPKDIGDFNNNGKLDILSLFVRNSFVDEQVDSNSIEFSDITYSQISNLWPVLAEDIDGDNLTEIIAIGSENDNESDSVLTIWEVNGSDLELEAELENFTSNKGTGNSFGAPNTAIGDINTASTNSQSSIWITDLDGDIISYRITGADNYSNSVEYETNLTSNENLLDIGDLTGDGIDELVVVLESDEDSDIAPFYELMLFNLVDNTLKNIYTKPFINVNSNEGLIFSQTDNSVRLLDLDNDSDDEIAIFLFPNAYILDYIENELKLIDYDENVNSEHVFFGDLDNNGLNEVAFPKSSGINFYEYGFPDRPSIPYIIQAYSSDEKQVFLKWNGKGEYFRIFRSTTHADFQLIDSTSTNEFYDKVPETDVIYYYYIDCYDPSFSLKYSNPGNIAEVFAHKPAEFENLEVVSSKNILLNFSLPILDEFTNDSFIVDDQKLNFTASKYNEQSFLVNFESELTEGEHILSFNGLLDIYNSPINRKTVEFTIDEEISELKFYINSYNVLNNDELEVFFNIQHDGNSALDKSNYSITNNNIIESIAESTSNSSIIIKTKYPFKVAGVNFTIKLNNIYSSPDCGNILIEEGAGSVIDLSFSTNSIKDAYAYPNPVKLSKNTKLKFANLTQNVEIWIFDINGNKIISFEFENSDELSAWDLKDDDGREISSGIYLLHIRSLDTKNEVKEEVTKKFAVIR
ncbi:MAG: S8 family peptidase [Ignavibacteria bacterium]